MELLILSLLRFLKEGGIALQLEFRFHQYVSSFCYRGYFNEISLIVFQHERWYLEMNPRGEVPVLKHGDDVIVDSNVIIEVRIKRFAINRLSLYSHKGLLTLPITTYVFVLRHDFNSSQKPLNQGKNVKMHFNLKKL